MISFAEESAVRGDHHRGTAWGKTGCTPVGEESGDRFGIEPISAVSPRGDMRFSVIGGRMTPDKFIGFLKKLRCDAGKPIIVIADNASCHASGKAARSARQGGEQITPGYPPSCAPELNPGEQVWSHAKARLAKIFVEGKEAMERSVLSIIRPIQRNVRLIRSFFQLETTRHAAELRSDFRNDQ